MPWLVPGTHAGPFHRGCSGRAGAIRGWERLGAAWVAGTSPAMTGGGRGSHRIRRALPHRAFSAPSTVMPGLVPGTHAGPRHRGSLGRAGAIRDWERLGAAWVAGTSPAMTGGRAGIDVAPPCPPSPCFQRSLNRHARACPGHPRRPAPSRVLGPGRGHPGLERRGAAWVAGTRPAMTGGRAGIDVAKACAPPTRLLHPLHRSVAPLVVRAAESPVRPGPPARARARRGCADRPSGRR